MEPSTNWRGLFSQRVYCTRPLRSRHPHLETWYNISEIKHDSFPYGRYVGLNTTLGREELQAWEEVEREREEAPP